MGTNPVVRGQTATAVADNVKTLRLQQNLGLRALSQRTDEAGRPLGHTAIDQIEKGKRRVDVDDLMTLAVALNVSPVRLMMPTTPSADSAVEATAVGRVTARQLWDYLTIESGGHPNRQTDVDLDWVMHSRPVWAQQTYTTGDIKALMDELRTKQGRSHGND